MAYRTALRELKKQLLCFQPVTHCEVSVLCRPQSLSLTINSFQRVWQVTQSSQNKTVRILTKNVRPSHFMSKLTKLNVLEIWISKSDQRHKKAPDFRNLFKSRPKLDPRNVPLHTGSLSFQWGLLGSTHSIVPEPCSMTKPGEQVKATVVPSWYVMSLLLKFPWGMKGSQQCSSSKAERR